MTSSSAPDLLSARLRAPEHVVYRSFAAETVVLNLRTGRYHGLNPTAGRMLDGLRDAPSAGALVPALAREYGVEPATVQADLLTLCNELLERGLIEIVDDEQS
jgi:PqqD family protein of HPr-rel-A system